ncbi:ATP-binding cassette domain-containing protein [Marispirochaeta aestuarii]|uniref:ABC transporter ATP-binding protein n=1 Tax=Marispirochaeta aestuarii TaxID=1963862 RepID=UPI0029C6D244|nr:ATP-binding cassette domain-containing protein [Marispirochaeta aestuarii]
MKKESGSAVLVQGLKKSFGDLTAVAGVDFEMHSGELFGFLGPNGAGKTTTINMLTGLARPDEGSIRIGGIDCSRNPRAAQHMLGVVPDESNLYPELSGFENLSFCGALYGMRKSEREKRAAELLEQFGLNQAGGRKFGAYSKGMKRKLTIAAGIIHKPRILFLDEPTTGIDVASARQVRQMIDDLHREGISIFLTTHYIEEAERLCDRIAFIVSGRIVKIAGVQELLQPIQNRHVLQMVFSGDVDAVKDGLTAEFRGFSFSFPQHGLMRVETDSPVGVGPLIRYMEEKGAEVFEARRIRPSLEEVFVSITGIEVGSMGSEKEKQGGKG